uniref:Uncharacterized protein n=1 Tax=Anguilla anguilla TaxID=7936 RepID=A0A0E9WY82_ANGAN
MGRLKKTAIKTMKYVKYSVKVILPFRKSNFLMGDNDVDNNDEETAALRCISVQNSQKKSITFKSVFIVPHITPAQWWFSNFTLSTEVFLCKWVVHHSLTESLWDYLSSDYSPALRAQVHCSEKGTVHHVSFMYKCTGKVC